MNTRILMISSALFLGLIGLAFSFFPQEILAYYTIYHQALLPKLLQLLGAALVGLAFTNWMAKGQLFGGVYGRPIAMGNLLHFFAGGSALLKGLNEAAADPVYSIIMLIYLLFAVAFGYTVFNSPKAVKTS